MIAPPAKIRIAYEVEKILDSQGLPRFVVWRRVEGMRSETGSRRMPRMEEVRDYVRSQVSADGAACTRLAGRVLVTHSFAGMDPPT